MIGGGREPLSPRRPYTRTHAPAIMYTGTTARLSKPRGPPTFAAMLAQHHLVHVCPTWTGAAGRGTFVPSPNFSEYVGQPRWAASVDPPCWSGRSTTSREMCSRLELLCDLASLDELSTGSEILALYW